MESPLTPEQIHLCEKKFNLSYHVNYAASCQELVGFAGKDVLEVGGSLPREFVFDYLHVQTWSAVETPEYEAVLDKAGGITHQGSVLHDTGHDLLHGFDKIGGSTYDVYLANIEDLPPAFHNRFDVVFSIAAFEHIQKLPAALEKMYSALRPGGKLFAVFSPVWSSGNGHHLPDIQDRKGNHFNFNNSPIPRWGHLLMSREELKAHLGQYTDNETVDTMLHYVFDAPSINRLFSEDYIEAVKNSRFEVEKMALCFLEKIPPKVQEELEKRYPGCRYFSNTGIRVILRRGI